MEWPTYFCFVFATECNIFRCWQREEEAGGTKIKKENIVKCAEKLLWALAVCYFAMLVNMLA